MKSFQKRGAFQGGPVHLTLEMKINGAGKNSPRLCARRLHAHCVRDFIETFRSSGECFDPCFTRM